MIVTGAAIQDIVASATIQAVIATAPEQGVIATITIDRLAGIRTLNHICRLIAMKLCEPFGRLHHDLLDLIQ
ncbi:hypothetical protein D9M68_389960 [compost metagenome]